MDTTKLLVRPISLEESHITATMASWIDIYCVARRICSIGHLWDATLIFHSSETGRRRPYLEIVGEALAGAPGVCRRRTLRFRFISGLLDPLIVLLLGTVAMIGLSLDGYSLLRPGKAKPPSLSNHVDFGVRSIFNRRWIGFGTGAGMWER